MKHDKLSLLIGMLAGAAAMYYLDSRLGRRRRALVRDRMVAVGHDAAYVAQAKGKRALDRLKGYAATLRLDRQSHRPPTSDEQLHDRIRARLGHVVSHPRSVEVDVRNGCVCLAGHILTNEQDSLIAEVEHMAGVRAVENKLICHDRPDRVPELQGGTELRGREQRAGQPSLH